MQETRWQLSLAHPAWSSRPQLCSVQYVHAKHRWISERREREGLNKRKGKLERERREERREARED